MPQPSKGTTYERAGRWFARVTIGPGKRPEFALPTVATLEAARERTAVLAGLAALLRPKASAEQVKAFLDHAATAKGRGVQAVRDAAEAIASGKVKPPDDGPVTVAKLAEQWWSGDLAKRFPDQVKVKRTSDDDRRLFARHILPSIGALAVADVSLADCERVMSGLERLPRKETGKKPKGPTPPLARNTRRTVAIALHRLFSLAVYPLKLRAASPIPKGFLPRPGATPAKSYLYPSEDRALMACEAVPLAARVFYGFLAREGMRRSEALRMTWADLDLTRGAVRLDKNKTDDPRAWAMSPGTAEALASWRSILDAEGHDVGDAAPVFATVGDGQRPDELRAHLHAAGVTRPELFEKTPQRLPLRIHDLRGTFVTLALAAGRSEAWVTDRTGHKSSAMIARYKRAARTAAEIQLGELDGLDVAIPELREASSEASTGPVGERSARRGKAESFNVSAGLGLAPPGRIERPAFGLGNGRETLPNGIQRAFPQGVPVEAPRPLTLQEPRLDALIAGQGPVLAAFARALAASLDTSNEGAARVALAGLLGVLASAHAPTAEGEPARVVDLATRRKGPRGAR